MQLKVINKTLTNIKVNLTDYKKVYQTFKWGSYEKELDWLTGRKINAAYNAIDRNAKNFRKNKIALYWEGGNGEKQKFTFLELSQLSNKLANLLVANGVSRGDRVFIFLPRVSQLYICFLGILKTGAIAGTLFSAFQEQALFDRLDNSQAKIVITNKLLFSRVDKIRHRLKHLEKVLVVDAQDFDIKFNKQSVNFRIAHMDQDDPAFMLYTSGTTGKPKGVVHRHLAILQEHLTAKWVLDLRDEDVYWCTADPGWVTGIAYEILGSWSNGASTVVFEGRFDPTKWYKIIEDYKVTVWYTAPTAIRMLMAEKEVVAKFDLSSLRHLASVGEPLNPEAIYWGLKAFGLAFHDNWWQTELGAICIANYPCLPIKPGSMGKSFPGVTAAIVDDNGNQLSPNKEGNLALRPNFPSLMMKIWRRPKKYKSYFLNGLASHERGAKRRVEWYISGDRAYQDKDGYFWFIGRADDVIKTAGERVGPFEVESALVSHPDVVEAGVIGKPDPVRGEIIKAFVVLKKDVRQSEKLKVELSEFVKKHLAGHAYPREVEFIDRLPKTRSGKIMRRVLKAKELGLPVGDTSTLEEY